MTSYEKQLQSYRRIPEPGSPQQTEAWALVEAARRMAVAIGTGDAKDKETRERMKGALRLNWRLWTIFQAELTRDDNELPADLRENMLTLCQFVDKHTVGCLAEPTAEKLLTLIDINRHIASGLMGSTTDDEDEDLANKEAAGIDVAAERAALSPPLAAPGPTPSKIEVDV